MSDAGELLTFATQGNEFSYHAEAARRIAGRQIGILEFDKFGDVVRASRSYYPGLGVIAINTAAGTVEKSAKSIVGKRTSALPPIVGRVDLPIELALIGSEEQTLEELNRHGVRCLAQKEGVMQCADFTKKHLPWLRVEIRSESTKAVQEALDYSDRNHVAIGPAYAAEHMGGVILGPRQINPEGSVTSFYVLQRDPRRQLLPIDQTKTEKVTALALVHPEGEGELAKIVEVAQRIGIQALRFIPYNTKDPTRHNPNIKKDGGILEIQHGYYDEEVPEFCARVNALEGKDGVHGPFDAKRLGEYDWYPSEPIDLGSLMEHVLYPEEPVDLQIASID